MRLDRRFPADKHSVPAARHFAVEVLDGALDDVRDSVMLMVSELAMNAVQHAGTDFTVGVDLTGETLLVEVADAGNGMPEIHPAPPVADLHGRGLFIVDQLSDAWGVAPALGGPGKKVWFRIGLVPEPGPPADSVNSRPEKQVGYRVIASPAHMGHAFIRMAHYSLTAADVSRPGMPRRPYANYARSHRNLGQRRVFRAAQPGGARSA